MEPRQKTPVSLDQTVGVICANCGNNLFKDVVLARKVSKFITGQPYDSIIPIPLLACSKCDTVSEDGQPDEVLDLLKRSGISQDVPVKSSIIE